MLLRRGRSQTLLIEQHAHAMLCGRIARALTGIFEVCDDRVLLACDLHDAGYATFDRRVIDDRDAPLPPDAFDMPLSQQLPLWNASAENAAMLDPYCGLLVSIHVLRLSAHAAGIPGQPQRIHVDDNRLRFDVNKFQHNQIELQECLRGRLGLRTDKPIHLGLPEHSDDPREIKLSQDLATLRVCDVLSLAACQEPMRFEQTPGLHPAGSPNIQFTLYRDPLERVLVSPWPFGAVDELRLSVPAWTWPRREPIELPCVLARR